MFCPQTKMSTHHIGVDLNIIFSVLYDKLIVYFCLQFFITHIVYNHRCQALENKIKPAGGQGG